MNLSKNTLILQNTNHRQMIEQKLALALLGVSVINSRKVNKPSCIAN